MATIVQAGGSQCLLSLSNLSVHPECLREGQIFEDSGASIRHGIVGRQIARDF